MEHDLPTASPVPDPDKSERNVSFSDKRFAEGVVTPKQLDTESMTEQIWQRVRVYGLRIGSYQLLAPEGVYCELLPNPKISPLPNAPSHMLGLCNLRGNLIPIYQLEPILGEKITEPNDKNSNNYALLIGEPTSGAAIVVKDKPKPMDMAQLELSEETFELPEILEKSTNRTFKNSSESWHVLNHVQLFNLLSNSAFHVV